MKMAKLEEVEKDWKKRGFSFGVWTDPPGQVWENYINDTDELFMVVKGNVELEIAEKKRVLKVGEEVLIPKNVRHSVRTSVEAGSQWLYGYGEK